MAKFGGFCVFLSASDLIHGEIGTNRFVMFVCVKLLFLIQGVEHFP